MAAVPTTNTAALDANETLAVLTDMTNIMRDGLAAYNRHTTTQGWTASNTIAIVALVVSFLGLFWQARHSIHAYFKPDAAAEAAFKRARDEETIKQRAQHAVANNIQQEALIIAQNRSVQERREQQL